MIIHFALSPRPHKMNCNSLPLKPKKFMKMLYKYEKCFADLASKASQTINYRNLKISLFGAKKILNVKQDEFIIIGFAKTAAG